MRLPVQLAAVLLVASASGAAAMAGVVTVSQRSRAFDQRSMDAVRGGVLRVSNDDVFVHQIYVDAPTMTFESAEQAPGQSIDVPLAVSGRFEVRCHIHPKMLLVVNVK